jgi:hypothetical protein
MTEAVHASGPAARGATVESGSLRFASELGGIGILGNGNDDVDDDFFLVVDTGGDDRYRGRVASSLGLDRPLGLLVDLGGNDVYGDGATGLSPACGLLGAGVLWDLAGDDVYLAGGRGIAHAICGAGILVDAAGNDVYEGHGAGTQGAATGGVALLIDLAGDDRYRSADRSQGFGGTLGVGLLIDLEGDDSYAGLGDEDGNDRPANFVQGAGLGLWNEASDGVNLGGGIGMLVDANGEDTYVAASFSQGAAYYRALGVLADLAGRDSYDARSHSQGAAVHYALAAFRDGGGDDRYGSGPDREPPVQSLGHGRDVSAGFFIEEGGDDEYLLGDRCAGSGELHALGFFWEIAGRDRYRGPAVTVDRSCCGTARAVGGMSTGFRPYEPARLNCTGIFFDAAGDDIYGDRDTPGARPGVFPGNGTTDVERDGRGLLGIALDAADDAGPPPPPARRPGNETGESDGPGEGIQTGK